MSWKRAQGLGSGCQLGLPAPPFTSGAAVGLVSLTLLISQVSVVSVSKCSGRLFLRGDLHLNVVT